MTERITALEYGTLSDAYDWFNRDLFDGTLAPCLITLNNRSSRSRGFYSHDRFAARAGNGKVAEVALNTDTFTRRTDVEILSTLAHEMAHAWQYQHGAPGRRGYHNAEWARQMEMIGLMPTSTGRPGGRRTGARMTHYIVPGGAFDHSAAAFLDRYALHWQAGAKDHDQTAKKRASKTKYECPLCGQAAWAKPDSHLLCGDCNGEPMIDEAGTAWSAYRGSRARANPWHEPAPKSHRIPHLSEIERMKERLRELRRRMQQAHPDKGGDAETFRQIREEYEALREVYLRRTTQQEAA